VLYVGDPFSTVQAVYLQGTLWRCDIIFIMVTCNERDKSCLCTQRYKGITFLNFVPSDNVFKVFDVSPSVGLSHAQICWGKILLPKVMLWCDREIFSTKYGISEGVCLNDC
jgi:hypothetical protein